MADGKRRSGAGSPPDGRWGWVIVGCCFMVMVCTRAVTRCISIFFVEFQAYFGADYSATAWIHSLVDCTTMLCAPLGSLVGNRWSCRVAVMLGGLLSSAGLLLSSFSSSLETLYLTMGVLTGLGFALCYTPAISMVGCYFGRGQALAYGVAMSGSGIGTFVLAPAVQLLIERYSWRGALLVLSGVVANLCVCGALLRPITARQVEEEPADGEGAECVQRWRLACYVVAVAMEGLCCLAAPLLRSFSLLVPFAVIFGYFDGAYVALIPVVTADAVGPRYLSSALGVVYFLHAVPYLVSPPIGGWLVDITGSYTSTFFLSGGALLASAAVLSAAAGVRHCRRRRRLAASRDTKPRPLCPSDQSRRFTDSDKESLGKAAS
ncbi:hypothetical protein EPR50_G00209860 [Perca flavescens]|uniref:Major facilitator superfamily (MFS) profile domain-containing protein n=1 Tax=Perca flavescens TaxID=8167 RepID=A0A484C6K3_PERFV|nr:hypothetical protein EPR50_G00209860 [Perca flavescens]